MQVENLLTEVNVNILEQRKCSQILHPKHSTPMSHAVREVAYQRDANNAEGTRMTAHRRRESTEADTISISLKVGRRNSQEHG